MGLRLRSEILPREDPEAIISDILEFNSGGFGFMFYSSALFLTRSDTLVISCSVLHVYNKISLGACFPP